MPTLGPFPINKGWVSDTDIYNCPPGGNLTAYGWTPFGGQGMATMDGQVFLTQLPNNALVDNFFYWQDPAQLGNSNTDIIIAYQSNSSKAYSSPINTVSWTDITNSKTIGAWPTFDVLNGKVIICASGGVAPLKLSTYNGVLNTLGGSPPNAQIVKCVNNFAFLGLNLSSSSTGSTLYWSAVSDPETWPSASNLTFRNLDGDVITALEALGQNLLIFKLNSIGLLNTSTVTISGTATLGPLTELSTKLGCVGPYAVDKMPDGTVVFMSSDRHLYQTDGTVFIDLSGQPAPASNVNYRINTINFASPFTVAVGPLYNTVVQVDPQGHRIFVKMTSGGAGGTPNIIYVYDYIYKAWMDWTELNNDTASGNSGKIWNMELLPSISGAGYGEQNKYMNMSTDAGYIFGLQPLGGLEHKSLSTDWTCTLETSIPLGSSSPPDFVPRSLIIPISQPFGSSAAIVKVFIGFDGTYAASPALTVTGLSTSNKRLIVPIFEVLDNVSLHPITMQVKIQCIANVSMGPIVVDALYISDEVLG